MPKPLIQLSALRDRVKLKSSYFPGNIQKHSMFLGGKRIGNLDVERNRVMESYIFDEYRKMGLGKKLYGDVLKRTPGKFLKSDTFVSPAAERVWQSMAKRPRSYRVRTSLVNGNPVYSAKLTALDRLMSRVVEFRARQPQQEEEKPHALKRIARVVAPLAVGALAYKYFYRRPNKDPMPDVKTPAMAALTAEKAAQQAATTQRRAENAILAKARDARRSEKVAKLTGSTASPSPSPVSTATATASPDVPTLKLVRRPRQEAPKTPSGPSPGSVVATAPKPTPAKVDFVAEGQRMEKDALTKTQVDVTPPRIRKQVDAIRDKTRNTVVEGKAATPSFVSKGKPIFTADPEDPDAIEAALNARDAFAKKSKIAKAPKVVKPVKASAPAAPAKVVKPVKASKPVASAKPQSAAEKRAASLRAYADEVGQVAEKKRKNLNAIIRRAIMFNVQDPFYGNQMATPAGFMSAYRKGRRLVPWIRRGTQVAEDTADIAVGKKPKDPFYKKSWFKSAAVGAALASPIYANRQLRKYRRTLQEGGSLGPIQQKVYNTVAKRAPWFIDAFSEKTRKIVELAMDAEMRGWDIRDPRGRSARVYAPGSQKRDRREKNWNEKTQNIRLIRNIALTGALGGVLGTAYYRNKYRKATGQTGKPVQLPGWFRGVVQNSARVGAIEFASKQDEKPSTAKKVAKVAGAGLVAAGAATLPAALPMLRIQGRRLDSGVRAKLGVKMKNDPTYGGKFVADYLTSANRALNQGPQGIVAGKIIQRNRAKTQPGSIGRFMADHYARFRAGPKEALGHWSYEVGQSVAQSAARKGKSVDEAIKPFNAARVKTEAAINDQLWNQGKNEIEAIRAVASNPDPEIQSHFRRLAAHKTGAVKRRYGPLAAASPAAIIAGGGLLAASRRKKQETEFARKNEPTLHRLTDAVKKNLPDRPELPGESPVRIVVENPRARSLLLRVLGAGAAAGAGALGGMALKKPRAGALLGGIGAGMMLRG